LFLHELIFVEDYQLLEVSVEGLLIVFLNYQLQMTKPSFAKIMLY
jgi:hypothetical protein